MLTENKLYKRLSINNLSNINLLSHETKIYCMHLWLALAWLVIPQPWSIVFWDGAFVYNSWRIYLSICGLPMLLGAFCLCFFPESPKFLMSQDRNEDALEVFKKIYSINTGLPKDNYPVST